VLFWGRRSSAGVGSANDRSATRCPDNPVPRHPCARPAERPHGARGADLSATPVSGFAPGSRLPPRRVPAGHEARSSSRRTSWRCRPRHRDLGFAGADWVAELEANVVELLDTGLDPCRSSGGAKTLLVTGACPRVTWWWRRVRAAASAGSRSADSPAECVRSYGATEVFRRKTRTSS